ncbi:MAG: type I-E CRISPR-associated protein Cas5/CasD [Myxococcales bacterium]|nr:type I-E CRISPR-associated protein Cas5/CasD [Polyangiaceae bacterium]MDW8251107.1 type I-E CRISPR-associated protein Cas5/CasD [Myxococcales bacterium]
MTEVLLLRLDAPLMSFGGVRVDNTNRTEAFPLRSMVAGLLANALGYEHKDFARTSALQGRLRLAARQDIPGERLVDYQTVDLSQDFLQQGWTMRHKVEGRKGGEASEGTHLRYRHYLADALYTLALSLDPPGEAPTLDELEASLREPERPLFLGRKPCLPSSPLLLGRCEAPSLLAALRQAPVARRRHQEGRREKLLAWWPADEEETPDSRLIPVFEDRDWENQSHTGRRFLREGLLSLSTEGSDG